MHRSTKDRRVRRTQQSLHGALMQLIIEKGYDAVTVNDILARADVGRSTFYSHHSGKESLLLSGIGTMREELIRAQREAMGASHPPELLGFSHALFAHVQDHRDLYRALGAEGSAVVLNRIHGLLAELVRAELPVAKHGDPARSVPRDAAIQFVVDAMLSIILWWVEKSPRLAPVEAEGIFRRLTVPAIKDASLT
jgi:AcrR family transcriptional regulator